MGDKWEYNEAIHQLFIDFEKAYDSVRREIVTTFSKIFWYTSIYLC
jgi:hypothetical protein